MWAEGRKSAIADMLNRIAVHANPPAIAIMTMPINTFAPTGVISTESH